MWLVRSILHILKKSSFILLLSGLLFIIRYPVSAQPPVTGSEEADFVPGEILVKFKPGLSVQNTRQRLADVQGQEVRAIPALNVMQVKIPQGQEQAAIAKLRARADVEFAEPNYIVRALEIPNDPGFGNQWGLSKINMPLAWDITKGNSNLIIAIVDSGIDLDHPDFSCIVTSGASKLTAGWNYIANNNNPNDDNGHGSHVAGIAGACTNNSTGVAGMAPNVRLMPVKVLDSNGNGTSASVANGVTFAVNNGAKIINLSLGAPSVGSVIENAVNYAYSQGRLVVAASGNTASTPLLYPAAFEHVMAVGSTTPSDTRSWFSTYGAGLDVVAPGSDIYSTIPGSYGYMSGTSMATPHVAGLAALIWTMEPGLTPDQVRQAIRDSSVDLGSPGWDQFYGYGRINGWQALERYSINLQTSAGLEISEPIQFLVDDENEPIPPESIVQIITASPQVISWTATIAPDVSWLTISSPASGTISSQSADNLILTPAQPASYGAYSASLVVTGTTTSGSVVGPATAEVYISFVHQLYPYRFPIIFKN